MSKSKSFANGNGSSEAGFSKVQAFDAGQPVRAEHWWTLVNGIPPR